MNRNGAMGSEGTILCRQHGYNTCSGSLIVLFLTMTTQGKLRTSWRYPKGMASYNFISITASSLAGKNLGCVSEIATKCAVKPCVQSAGQATQFGFSNTFKSASVRIP